MLGNNSVAVAKELEALPENAARVKGRINELEKRHQEDIHRLYQWQAEDHFAEAEDQYLSKDDAITDSQTDVSKLLSRFPRSLKNRWLQALYRSLHGPNPREKAVFDDAVASLRYAHLNSLTGLRRQHATLVAKEEEERRWRDAQFPADLAVFHAIQNKDTQVLYLYHRSSRTFSPRL